MTKFLHKKFILPLLAVIISVMFIFTLFSGYLGEKERKNNIPVVEVRYPKDDATVSKIVTISGVASDPDGDKTIKRVEVKTDSEWFYADGTTKWSYEWNTYDVEEGYYTIEVRAWDGADYSKVEKIKVRVFKPEVVQSDAHKWAVFIISANFPEDNESKLGNGGLYLAEEMSTYFIENYGFPTSNVYILFDDGWIRSDNGFGERIETLQERYHQYDITYGAATKEVVVSYLENVITEANNFDNSEVFIWIMGHGWGDTSNPWTGGKLLERSGVFLWDKEILEDKELGVILSNLQSKKTCIIVDACFSGGFADKTIYNFPTFFLLRSKIPKPGRVVITGASKFRAGYASTTEGSLFSILWFKGLTTGEADGYRPGLLETGRPTRLNVFKDGKVSVEEAFYYARYMLKEDENLKEYSKMEPQINDQYPDKGTLRSLKGLILE